MRQTLGPAISAPVLELSGFRLTTESAVPVSGSDRSAQGTIYLTPYVSNVIWTYDTSLGWQRRVSGEVSLLLSSALAGAGIASGSNYDVFVYFTGSALALELGVAWTSDTARHASGAVERQDGVWVLTSNHTRRLVGTIRASGTNVVADSEAQRFVWNTHNRVQRQLRCFDTTDSWTYSTDTWRASNSSTTDGVGRFAYVCGLNEDPVSAWNLQNLSGTAIRNAGPGIGIDVTNANSAHAHGGSTSGNGSCVTCFYLGRPGLGYHFIQRLERSQAAATQTWFGDAGGATNNSVYQSGMSGLVFA